MPFRHLKSRDKEENVKLDDIDIEGNKKSRDKEDGDKADDTYMEGNETFEITKKDQRKRHKIHEQIHDNIKNTVKEEKQTEVDKINDHDNIENTAEIDTKMDMEVNEKEEDTVNQSSSKEFTLSDIIGEIKDIEISCFYNSTPTKTDNQSECEECTKDEQCGDCLIRQHQEERSMVVSGHFPFNCHNLRQPNATLG